VPFEANDFDQAACDRIYTEADRQVAAACERVRRSWTPRRNFRRKERDLARRFAADNAGQALIVHVDTPESVARDRRLANARLQTRVDWGDVGFDAIASAMEVPTAEEEPLVFHYIDDISNWIEHHRRRLAPGFGSTRDDGA
jgi:hypothetical protein